MVGKGEAGVNIYYAVIEGTAIAAAAVHGQGFAGSDINDTIGGTKGAYGWGEITV